MQLRSPNELMNAAKQEMLEGKEPSTRRDWQAVFNFMAHNVAPQVQPEALFVIAMIFDAPLTKSEIQKISDFQLKEKA